MTCKVKHVIVVPYISGSFLRPTFLLNPAQFCLYGGNGLIGFDANHTCVVFSLYQIDVIEIGGCPMINNHVAGYPQLKIALESAEKIVYLMGAGASMALGEHRNSWGAWLNAGREMLIPEQQTAFDELLGDWSTDALISAASYVLKMLKANGHYEQFMNKTIGTQHPAEQTLMDAVRKIWRAGDLVATTNYDLLLEKTIGAAYVTYEQPGEILSVIKGTADNKVIHLHGVYDQEAGQDSIIADGEQYRSILENAGAQFIQNLLSTYPIIIVGCGGTVSDPNLSGFMQFVVDKLGLDIPYFYLMKEGDTPPVLPANAVLVYYGTDHADLPAFMEEISAYRLRDRSEVKQLIQINPYEVPRRVVSAFGRMHFSNCFNDFVGKQDEMQMLNAFLQADESILWWSVLGEGGIGKSRLLLEWLRALPANWFGFFARKDVEMFAKFVPFTDTVIVLDYILGQEEICAKLIAVLMEQFCESHHRLRLVLVERKQDDSADNWLSKLAGALEIQDHLRFEQYQYINGAISGDDAAMLCLGALKEADEVCYVKDYLQAYMTAFMPQNDTYHRIMADLQNVSKRVVHDYRNALEEPFRRPLYLSIFTEVWINREGAIEIRGVKQLLQVYFEREIERWTVLLREDALVNSYLKLLAMACVLGHFNITDVHGENYLREDCVLLSEFLDGKNDSVRKQGIFYDLFVWEDELEEYDIEDTGSVFLHAYKELDMSADEKLAFSAPYIKLDADPEEMFLQMLKGAGGLTEEEQIRLEELHEENRKKAEELPDFAWIIEPVLPDIIKAYVVLYVVKERDLVRFTKLARANSVFGLSEFLQRAIEDWPEEDLFQKMMVIPPKNELDYFEFYVSLLANARQVSDFRPVEKELIDTNATIIYARYEMELWYRIAIVLTERGDWQRLLESAENYIEYAKETFDHPKVKERLTDVLSAYALGLHNAEEADKFGHFLDGCDSLYEVYEDKRQLALFCVDNRGKLLHLRRYLSQPELMENEWNVIVKYMLEHKDDREICLCAITIANEFYDGIRRYGINERQCVEDLVQNLEDLYITQPVVEVAELLALSTANMCFLRIKDGEGYCDSLFEKIKGYLRVFPQSRRIRSAYATVCAEKYARDFNRFRDVPPKIMGRLKKWSDQYPDEIEFREAYFHILLAHLEYAQAHEMKAEEKRTFHEMEQLARSANYDQYLEENQLQKDVELLRDIWDY